MGCIFSASQIIEKHREFNIPTYISFIDFKKAFDSVDRDKLWTIMLGKGIPTDLITMIKKIYKGNIIRVNAGNGISEDSRAITQRVRQGCPLSTVLFNLYLDEVIRIWLQKLKYSKYFKELIFNTLLFADGQLLFPTQKTTYKRQSIYYITYLKNITWKLLQKRRKYLVSLERIT